MNIQRKSGMKKLNQQGSHIVTVVLAIVVVAFIGLAGWRVFGSKKNSINNKGSKQELATTAQPKSDEPKDLIWQQTASGWQASQKAPTCPEPLSLKVPADISKVTSILYPGQTRGGNYKPHGGLRFDSTANDKITVVAPIDGFLVRGGRYMAEGEVQYTFDAMNNCGIMYRVGHLRALPSNLQKIADTWPEPKEGDSRTQSIMPAVLVKQGETLATSVGIVKDKNTFFDWGVYDYRKENDASKDPAFQQKHAQDKELSWHAVCWFNLLDTKDSIIVRNLPAGDSASGKNSDYCK